jgi:hypothetical protein
MIEITLFQTSDGLQHTTAEAAMAHEVTLANDARADQFRLAMSEAGYATFATTAANAVRVFLAWEAGGKIASKSSL